MDDFEAVIVSLGEHSVTYIGNEHLRQLSVFGDPSGQSARIEICLESNTWAEQSRAIEKMLELRSMFLDELSIDYVFVDEDSCTEAAAQVSDFSFA